MVTAEERASLREACRTFLESESPIAKVRQSLEDGPGMDLALWKEMAELGWSGVLVPEELGGSGLDLENAAIIVEEIGRQLTPCPFVSSSLLATAALVAAGSDKQKQQLLPAMAAGDTIGTIALSGSGRYDAAGVEVRASRKGQQVQLSGVAAFVPDGHVTDFVVVAARETDGALSFYIVESHAEGLHVTPQNAIDLTRQFAKLELQGVDLPIEARLGQPGEGDALYGSLIDVGALALGADSSGGARRALEVSVEFAKNRVQFGRPIGSFQAIKHRLADLYLLVEASAAATRRAARDLTNGMDGSASASLAKSYATDAYATVAGDAIRVHGAVGLTWEYDQHLYLKRAKLNQQLFGDPAWHRERLLTSVLAERSNDARGGR